MSHLLHDSFPLSLSPNFSSTYLFFYLLLLSSLLPVSPSLPSSPTPLQLHLPLPFFTSSSLLPNPLISYSPHSFPPLYSPASSSPPPSISSFPLLPCHFISHSSSSLPPLFFPASLSRVPFPLFLASLPLTVHLTVTLQVIFHPHSSLLPLYSPASSSPSCTPLLTPASVSPTLCSLFLHSTPLNIHLFFPLLSVFHSYPMPVHPPLPSLSSFIVIPCLAPSTLLPYQFTSHSTHSFLQQFSDSPHSIITFTNQFFFHSPSSLSALNLAVPSPTLPSLLHSFLPGHLKPVSLPFLLFSHAS